VAADFVDADKQVPDAAAALEGARAILVERFAEDADLNRHAARADVVERTGGVHGAQGQEAEGEKFKDYFDFSEAAAQLPSHRILAIVPRREGRDPRAADRAGRASAGRGRLLFLRAEDHAALCHFRSGPPRRPLLGGDRAVGVAYQIQVHLNIDLRMRLWTAAETKPCGCLHRICANLLLAAPAGARVTWPRSGLRLRCQGRRRRSTGKVVATTAIYPHERKSAGTSAGDAGEIGGGRTASI